VLWPPNSPDLNPVDYLIWAAFQQLVYRRRRRIRDVEHLKKLLQTCWEQIGQDVIDHAIGQFCKHCCSLLLQLVEDTLSTALNNVLGATRPLRPLSYLRVLL